jgi:hypothetical protein
VTTVTLSSLIHPPIIPSAARHSSLAPACSTVVRTEPLAGSVTSSGSHPAVSSLLLSAQRWRVGAFWCRPLLQVHSVGSILAASCWATARGTLSGSHSYQYPVLSLFPHSPTHPLSLSQPPRVPTQFPTPLGDSRRLGIGLRQDSSLHPAPISVYASSFKYFQFVLMKHSCWMRTFDWEDAQLHLALSLVLEASLYSPWTHIPA